MANSKQEMDEMHTKGARMAEACLSPLPFYFQYLDAEERVAFWGGFLSFLHGACKQSIGKDKAAEIAEQISSAMRQRQPELSGEH